VFEMGELENLINKEMGELDLITNILDKKKSKFNEQLNEIENNARNSMSVKKNRRRYKSKDSAYKTLDNKENTDLHCLKRRS